MRFATHALCTPSAVIPSLSLGRSTSAPAALSALRHPAWPPPAASVATRPPRKRVEEAWTFAPASTHRATHPTCPSAAAAISAVRPFASRVSVGSLHLWKSVSRTSSRPRTRRRRVELALPVVVARRDRRLCRGGRRGLARAGGDGGERGGAELRVADLRGGRVGRGCVGVVEDGGEDAEVVALGGGDEVAVRLEQPVDVPALVRLVRGGVRDAEVPASGARLHRDRTWTAPRRVRRGGARRGGRRAAEGRASLGTRRPERGFARAGDGARRDAMLAADIAAVDDSPRARERLLEGERGGGAT